MKLILAAPDRDFLRSFGKLLEERFGEVSTAFDGTQLHELLEGGSYDLAILDRDLPRIAHSRLVRLLKKEGIQVLVLLDEALSPQILASEPLADAYLSYPFFSDELIALCEAMLERPAKAEEGSFEASLSFGERELLEALRRKERPDVERAGVYVASLNQKFAKFERKARIRYLTGKGFELVEEYE